MSKETKSRHNAKFWLNRRIPQVYTSSEPEKKVAACLIIPQSQFNSQGYESILPTSHTNNLSSH